MNLDEAIGNYRKGELARALEQFLDLAKQDNEEAFYYLALIYSQGEGVAVDERQAKRYKDRYVQIVKMKADAGDTTYQYKYATILQQGDGIQANEAAALLLYSKLARQGHGQSQFRLYTIYHYGTCGQQPNDALAQKWLSKAAENQWPEALAVLAQP